MERQRQERVVQLATLIQKTFRGWRCRMHYQQMRKSQIIISAWFRGHMVRKEQGVLAALPLPHPSPPGQGPLGSSKHPGSPQLSPPQQKNKYRQMKWSALIIQAHVRGWKVSAGHPVAAGRGQQVS